MSSSLNVLVPGLALWRLGRRRLGAALAGMGVFGLFGMILLTIGTDGTRMAWVALIPLCLVAMAYALSHTLLRNELSVRCEPVWRLHVASLRETLEAHMERGRTIDALLVLEKWLRDDPHSAEAWVFRARLDAANGKLNRARLAYQRAARWDGDGRFTDEIRHALEVLGNSPR